MPAKQGSASSNRRRLSVPPRLVRGGTRLAAWIFLFILHHIDLRMYAHDVFIERKFPIKIRTQIRLYSQSEANVATRFRTQEGRLRGGEADCVRFLRVFRPRVRPFAAVAFSVREEHLIRKPVFPFVLAARRAVFRQVRFYKIGVLRERLNVIPVDFNRIQRSSVQICHRREAYAFSESRDPCVQRRCLLYTSRCV